MRLIRDVMSAAAAFMTNELGLESTVVSVDKIDEGWLATAETILVDDEMRRLAKKDLVATFELILDEAYQVKSFARRGMRERGSIPRSSSGAR